MPLFVGILSLLSYWSFSGDPLNPAARNRFRRSFARRREQWESAQKQGGLRARLGYLRTLDPAALMPSSVDPLWATPDGSLEPRQFFEGDYHRRRRCARNHVRLLLRGKGW